MADLTASVVIPLVIVVVTVLLILVCCFHNGKLVHPSVKYNYYKKLQSIRRTDLLFKLCDQSTTRDVENHIIHQRLRLRGQIWNKQLDVGRKGVVVFCVVSSRIGTDIDSALSGVNERSPVILVVLHSVHKSMLSGDLTDHEYLLDQKTRERVLGIVHFAFSEYERLYKCGQNEIGFQKLLDLLEAVSNLRF